MRKQEPQRAVDRLLVAGLIEARSCERFHVLAEHVKDAELAEFYRSLFESEARHHTTYTRLAKHFAPEADVMSRLDELADVGSRDHHPRRRTAADAQLGFTAEDTECTEQEDRHCKFVICHWHSDMTNFKLHICNASSISSVSLCPLW